MLLQSAPDDLKGETVGVRGRGVAGDAQRAAYLFTIGDAPSSIYGQVSM
jgi:hypothetical protein